MEKPGEGVENTIIDESAGPPLGRRQEITDQTYAGGGRTQRSHLQVASKETALCTPLAFPASEFTLTTMPLSGDC